jgi:hypothetical protein
MEDSHYTELKKRYDVNEWIKKAYPENKESYTPPSSPSANESDFLYIAYLLQHPIPDGRHRTLWLILAPYLVNVLKLSEESACDILDKYYEMCNAYSPTTINYGLISYFVNYAKVSGLWPPRLETLKGTEPQLYEIISGVLNECV